MLVVTSLALLWLIILAIDGRAGEQITGAVRANVSTNGSALRQLTDSAEHVTRSAWEMSFLYGPLMTFGAVAAILLVVMNRSSK